jgi:subtilisin family serine protease
MLQDDDVCYLIARVFGDDDKSTSTSSVVAAVEWLEDQGAKVINMSLGGTSRSNSVQLAETGDVGDCFFWKWFSG